MVVGILQPGYLPWLGFFEQLYRSDVFVIYDDVQYDKNGWRNRNRIKTSNGIQWLTVPVLFKFEEHPRVFEVRVDNKSNWRKKHLMSIRQSYAKAPFFMDYIDIFEKTYSLEWSHLVDLDLHLINKLATALGLQNRKIVRSSSLDIQGGRIDRLIRICRHFKADTFYEGASGVNYIDPSDFMKHGINVEFQNYHHPVYQQSHGDFVPYLSIVDLLFNYGNTSMDILLGNYKPEVTC